MCAGADAVFTSCALASVVSALLGCPPVTRLGPHTVPRANSSLHLCPPFSLPWHVCARGVEQVIVFGESFAGVLVGGRTGLTAVVMGICFLGALPLAPVLTAVPLFASSPVLVLVGTGLLPLATRIDFSGTTGLPTFCVVALMPFLYAIDKALLVGLGVHALMVGLDWLAPPSKMAALEA